MTVDRDRVRRALAALDALLAEHPELRRPAARRRLDAVLAEIGAEQGAVMDGAVGHGGRRS